MPELTFLVVDDGDDGFILVEHGSVIHSSFRHATKWSDSDEGLENAKKVINYAPSARIMRVRCDLQEI